MRGCVGTLVDVVEGMLFAFLATLVMLLPIGIACVMLFKEGLKGAWPRAAAWSVIALWFPLDAPLIGRVWLAVVRGYQPVAVYAALRQPRWPTALRPFVAIWWLAHFLLGAFGGFSVEVAANQSGATGETAVALMVVVVLYTLAANGYLAQAVAAIGGSERAVRTVWRWRVLIDFAIALAAYLAGNAARSR